MSTPLQNTRREHVVSYGSDDFEQTVASIEEALREGKGVRFLFVGASKEEKQEALTAITEHGNELNLHRFKVPNLIGERLVETQGNLREAFDHADEEAAVLFFDGADVLFEPSHDEKADEEDAALSNYFFDRIENYLGVGVVCLSSAQYVNRLEEHEADVIVEF